MRFVKGDLVLVNITLLSGRMKAEYGSVKNCCVEGVRLKKMRDSLGAPILPRKLYSPLYPSDRLLFWK